MIECDVIRDLIPLYADGVASEASRKLVEKHTAGCPGCRGQLRAMCAPLEPVPLEENEAYIRAIREQNKRNIRRTIIGCAVVALVCLIIWWAYMETSFSGESLEVVCTDAETILKEQPLLELSKADKLLGETLLGLEVIQEAMGADEAQIILFGEVEEAIHDFIPRNVEFDDISVYGTMIYFDYRTENTRVITGFNDLDRDGQPDGISKTVATSISPYSQEVDEIYELVCDMETGELRYRKYENKHMWFSFLDVS